MGDMERTEYDDILGTSWESRQLPQYAREYTDLVRAAVLAMKKANPDCVILAGSVSKCGLSLINGCPMFCRWYVGYPLGYWSVHPYGVKVPEDYMEAYSHTRNLMKKAGGDTGRLWINSERGFPLGKAEGYAGGDPSLAYEYQAWHRDSAIPC